MNAGIVRTKMDRAEYERSDRVNWSTLKNMDRSPLHYQHGLLNPPKETDAMRLGRCGHLASLEPDLFWTKVVCWDDGIRRGKAWDAFKTANADREILTESEYRDVLAIQRAVRLNEAASHYLSGPGEPEVAVMWTYRQAPIQHLPGWEIECKGRLDYVTPNAIVDLKTVKDASPRGFGRAVAAYDWHVQAAFYVDGYEAATGERRPYVLIAVEKYPPYAVAVYRVPPDILEVGRQEYRQLLARLRMCRETNTWPGYAEGEIDLTLPRWAMPEDEENNEDVTGFDLVIGG